MFSNIQHLHPQCECQTESYSLLLYCGYKNRLKCNTIEECFRVLEGQMYMCIGFYLG